MFEYNNVQNEIILRDVCIFWTWQHPNRSNSARLRQFSTWQLRKQSNSARLPSKMESWVQSWQPRTNAFCNFSSPATKNWCQVIRSAAPVTQNHLCKPTDLMLQNETPLGNQRPDFLTSLRNMSFVLLLPRKMHLCRSSSNAPRLPWFLEMRQNPHVLLIFDKVHNPLRLPRETTSEPPKVARTCGALYILTSKCASRHNGVHFFPEVVRAWCVLYILSSKSASRHNDVQCFISHLARCLRTRRFSEPTFRPSGATNYWKNSVSRLSYLFAHLHLRSSDSFLFSLPLPCSAFHLSILSEVWLLNFLRSYA